ncbi:hypothetical protein TW95_gp0523 [Pandoravirus inopinatum]|uniref:Uncharacterized protein n=1 Tax=Pandoravirus inopinatum TaxID=1605721 RepID=A0A0B5JCC6_9VIRU|nr:hypothetical protein TW95_gp0523 [Pandoravirus inopinatum]AJF97257.1 hypothetical protein [Pandoravirus inopinatum]
MNGDPMDSDNHNGSTTAAMVSLSALQLWRVCPDSQSTTRPASLSQRSVLDVLAAAPACRPKRPRAQTWSPCIRLFGAHSMTSTPPCREASLGCANRSRLCRCWRPRDGRCRRATEALHLLHTRSTP